MIPKFAIFAFMKKDGPQPALSDSQIFTIIKQYNEALSHIGALLEKAADDLIGGSAVTVARKRSGNRPLSEGDILAIVNGVGSEQDKRAFAALGEAQRAITLRIKNAKAKGIILDQADISQPEWRKRQTDHTVWKPEQMLRIVEVLDRLRV